MRERTACLFIRFVSVCIWHARIAKDRKYAGKINTQHTVPAFPVSARVSGKWTVGAMRPGTLTNMFVDHHQRLNGGIANRRCGIAEQQNDRLNVRFERQRLRAIAANEMYANVLLYSVHISALVKLRGPTSSHAQTQLHNHRGTTTDIRTDSASP